MPQVSVIVPNYNHSLYLKERLDSIFNQSFQDFEVILLDDCSTDRSKDILNEYAKRPQVSHLVINTENTGNTFKQWKRGIKLAKGEWIWIAESDDYCDTDFLQKMLIYSTDNSLVLISAESKIVDETGKYISSTKFWKARPEKGYNKVLNGPGLCEKELVMNNIFPNASGLLFRKSKFPTELDFERSRKFGDWILWFELLLQGNVVLLSEELNSFRKHGANVTPLDAGFAENKRETLGILLDFNESFKREHRNNEQVLSSILNWTFKDAPWASSITLDLNTWRNFLFVCNQNNINKGTFLFKSFKFCLAHIVHGKMTWKK